LAAEGILGALCLATFREKRTFTQSRKWLSPLRIRGKALPVHEGSALYFTGYFYASLPLWQASSSSLLIFVPQSEVVTESAERPLKPAWRPGILGRDSKRDQTRAKWFAKARAGAAGQIRRSRSSAPSFHQTYLTPRLRLEP